MSDVNKVLLFGRLGADPVKRETKEGKPVTQFSVATSYRNKNKEQETQWHRVVCWGKLAEITSDRLGKGDSVFIEGSYRSRRYETQAGESRLNFEVLADRIEFVRKAQESEESEETAEAV